MSLELFYTSAPRGLKPGSRGFCTVACTQGMNRQTIERLEALSGYRHLFGPGDPRAKSNPVAYSHLVIAVSGSRRHVLSRVGDSGLDYTQRTNKFAHHLLLDAAELPLAGPAWLLSAPGVMRDRWEGEPGWLPQGPPVPRGESQPGICRAWQKLTGDAGWGGVLAESTKGNRPVAIIFPPGADMLPLIAESLALLPNELRWNITFSTYFTSLPTGVACQWRCLAEGTPEAAAARREANSNLVIDLCAPLGPAAGSLLVEAARTGVLPAAQPSIPQPFAPPASDSSVDQLEYALKNVTPGEYAGGVRYPPRPAPTPPSSFPEDGIEKRPPAFIRERPASKSPARWPWYLAIAFLLILLSLNIGFFLLNYNKTPVARGSLVENQSQARKPETKTDKPSQKNESEVTKPEEKPVKKNEPEENKSQDVMPQEAEPQGNKSGKNDISDENNKSSTSPPGTEVSPNKGAKDEHAGKATSEKGVGNPSPFEKKEGTPATPNVGGKKQDSRPTYKTFAIPPCEYQSLGKFPEAITFNIEGNGIHFIGVDNNITSAPEDGRINVQLKDFNKPIGRFQLDDKKFSLSFKWLNKHDKAAALRFCLLNETKDGASTNIYIRLLEPKYETLDFPTDDNPKTISLGHIPDSIIQNKRLFITPIKQLGADCTNDQIEINQDNITFNFENTKIFYKISCKNDVKNTSVYNAVLSFTKAEDVSRHDATLVNISKKTEEIRRKKKNVCDILKPISRRLDNPQIISILKTEKNALHIVEYDQKKMDYFITIIKPNSPNLQLSKMEEENIDEAKKIMEAVSLDEKFVDNVKKDMNKLKDAKLHFRAYIKIPDGKIEHEVDIINSEQGN